MRGNSHICWMLKNIESWLDIGLVRCMCQPSNSLPPLSYRIGVRVFFLNGFSRHVRLLTRSSKTQVLPTATLACFGPLFLTAMLWKGSGMGSSDFVTGCHERWSTETWWSRMPGFEAGRPGAV